MANDWLLIKCKNCKKEIGMAKYYPTIGHGVWNESELIDFIDKHMECSKYFGQNSLNGDSCFEINSQSKGYDMRV